ncbi:MAG: amidohydrolase [Anaerolineae bacterium]|nr:MAG: amidohydrolase [Anaerolineae bacterium]
MGTQADWKVLFNGKVVTVDAAFSFAEAVSICGEKIVSVGSNDQVKASAPANAQMIDLRGKTLIPGYVDSHVHMQEISLLKSKVSLDSTRSIRELLSVIGEACRSAGPRKWVITAKGFHPDTLQEKRMPTLEELDSVSANNPVFFVYRMRDNMVNSQALRLAGITAESPNPENGTLGKDPETGRLTGRLGDAASRPFKEMFPIPTDRQKQEWLKQTMRDFNQVGVTTVGDSHVTMEGLGTYAQLWTKGDMTVRARVGPSLWPWIDHGPIRTEQVELGPNGFSESIGLSSAGDAWLRVDSIKTSLDWFTTSACMSEPYQLVPGEQEAPEYRGSLTMSRQEFLELCRRVAQHGWRLATHAIGDAAIDAFLDVLEELDQDIPIVDKHWHLIHATMARQDHYERIKRLGVYIPCQFLYTYKAGAAMVKWWGSDRANRSNPMKSFLDAGIRVGGGSDTFLSYQWNPSFMMWLDVTRQTIQAGVLGPEERLTREQSLMSHTIDAARMSDDDDKIGSIEPGKFADLAVLSDDILTCPTEEMKEIKTWMTIVDGKIVHQI